MEIKTVDARFAVSPQITAADVPAIAAAGFRKVISNRPDGEESGQPETEEIRRAAEEAGLSFEHIPVAGGAFSPEQVAAFAQARRSADGPVLAFCRTGTRSITIDTLANVDGLSIDDRLSRAAQAGYDLTGQRQRMLQSAEESEHAGY